MECIYKIFNIKKWLKLKKTIASSAKEARNSYFMVMRILLPKWKRQQEENRTRLNSILHPKGPRKTKPREQILFRNLDNVDVIRNSLIGV